MALVKPWDTKSGVTQHSLGEIRSRARELLESDDYRTNIVQRIKNNTLPAQIEALLYYYAYGKPVENVQLNVTHNDSFESLSVDELQVITRDALKALEEVKALESAIDTSPTSTSIQ